MKLWGGRFAKETNEMVDEFNACIGFGSRLYEQDILGSIAHATMLGEQNIIPQEDAAKKAPKKGIPDYTCKEGESL